jgi:SET domain-containing protein
MGARNTSRLTRGTQVPKFGAGIPAGLLAEALYENESSGVIVKLSSIHGLGLFARRTFATGETVLVRKERAVTPERPLDAERGEVEAYCERLEGGRQVYLGYPARFVNHSCEPNAFLRSQDARNHVVVLKPIRPNEEIVMHYSLNRSAGTTWRCNCGAARCIGEVPGGFFSLPLDVQVELSPLLTAWFVAEHADAYRAFLRTAGLPADDARIS